MHLMLKLLEGKYKVTSNNVIDFLEEKEKRKINIHPLDYPIEGPVPLNERMMKACHDTENHYHQREIDMDWYNGS